MAPNNNFNRNHTFAVRREFENEPISIEEINVIEPFSIFQIDIHGNYVSDKDVFDIDHPNCTPEVVDQLFEMLPGIKYIGCINCLIPIGFVCEIIEPIYANQHNNIPVAYAFSIIPASLLVENATIWPISMNIWKTIVRCDNCNIFLSIPALTVINKAIENYSNDSQFTVLLDASSIAFFIKQID